MKKILFGICALALSATAFGANSGVIGENGGQVALPVRIQANVVDGSNRLFIEGTAGGTFGDILELNFGDLSTGQSGKTDGTIKVYKGLKEEDQEYKAQAFDGDLSLKILAKQGDQDYKDVDFKENDPKDVELINGANKEKTLMSRLTLTSMNFDQGDSKTSTLLTAKVMATTDKVTVGDETGEIPAGQYYGSTTITAVLKLNTVDD